MAKKEANPCVEMVINDQSGDNKTLKIELYSDKAPKTVENFIKYAEDKFYDGTIFHRIIEGFMIQGGGFTPDMEQKETLEPIQNEASSALKNELGTLAMARTSDVHSATSQFFINVENNVFLDFREPTDEGFGYAVFGKVTEGLDHVIALSQVETTQVGFYGDVPKNNVVIESINLV